jgi:cytochrome c biogenesis protein CcmG/thiol:disulfide interchange protein DsbE
VLVTIAAQKNDRSKHALTVAGLALGVFVVVLVLARGLQLDPTKVASPLVGKPAPPFEVTVIQDGGNNAAAASGKVDLSLLQGKAVILNFWASWCVSCREEAHDLEAFWRRYKQQVIVVGVAIQDRRDDALQFAKQMGKTYLLALDESGKATIDYGVYGVPETFLIDKNGVIRHKEAGPVDVASLEKLLPKIGITPL